MDPVNASNNDTTDMREVAMEDNPVEADDYKYDIDELFAKLEQRVDEVEQFYLNTAIKKPNTYGNTLMVKDKEKEREKQIPSMKKLQQEASRREAIAAKRMQDLMRQFGTIFRQFDSQVSEPRYQPQRKIIFDYCYSLSVTQRGYFVLELNFTMKGGDVYVVDNPTVMIPREDGSGYAYCLAIVKSDDIDCWIWYT